VAFDPPPLGPHVQQIRKKKRLTLDQLAAMSGVSRSMLSQIERGETNPTFATLWNLTRALGVDVAELVRGHSGRQAAAIAVVPVHFTPEIRTADGSCLLRILSPAANAGGFEWYELVIQPGGALVSEPHGLGAAEHLTVLEAALEVQSGEEIVAVTVGDTARYPVDVPHAIRNRSDQVARALLVVIN
jgi:transcriptional regulator with XRE-family HTH domain